MRSLIKYTSTGTLLLTTVGCAQLGTYEAAALDRGRTVIDSANERALWQLCEGSTLGAYHRLPMPVQDALEALCDARTPSWEKP